MKQLVSFAAEYWILAFDSQSDQEWIEVWVRVQIVRLWTFTEKQQQQQALWLKPGKGLLGHT